MIQLPAEPKVISHEGNRAVFEISPLYPGYGMTIGNTLRRVLISSLEGASVTSVKIKGVDHEFSAISGIMEDVVQIVLNLKKVRFKMFRDEPIMLTLSAKGVANVTAGDIKTTSDVEVITKDQHIATLTDKKSELEMEITVERGTGYVPVEQRQKDKLSVGEIAIDGIFTPVKNVNFTVENIRVMQRTDYNKVMLDVETDGSITPQEAIKQATQILIKHFEVINMIAVPEVTEVSKEKKARKKKDDDKEE